MKTPFLYVKQTLGHLIWFAAYETAALSWIGHISESESGVPIMKYIIRYD
jgi:hypothetical protein